MWESINDQAQPMQPEPEDFTVIRNYGQLMRFSVYLTQQVWDRFVKRDPEEKKIDMVLVLPDIVGIEPSRIKDAIDQRLWKDMPRITDIRYKSNGDKLTAVCVEMKVPERPPSPPAYASPGFDCRGFFSEPSDGLGMVIGMILGLIMLFVRYLIDC
jgi:hypothetical protein